MRRRRFLTLATGGTATAFGSLFRGEHLQAASVIQPNSPKHLLVDQIERTTVRVPFREIPRRAMDRELPHWRYSEVFRVQLRSGIIGIGETLLFYTWGVTQDKDVERALGTNASAMMWDDSLGAGLQMALFDAVAKVLGVPIHRLLGSQVHTRTPLSWWNIDMPPEDVAAECTEAYRAGYLSYKTKGRPWFDLWQQVESAASVVPDHFKIDMDFNDTLLDAERAIPILKDLDRYPQIDIYETPIPQGDIDGNRRIREATRAKIAMHYGSPEPRVAVEERVCDGFVIGGGASRVMTQGQFADQVQMPFWLQLAGTDITAAFSLHFGAVLTQATWPAVNCHQLYTHRLLTESIVVREGFAEVPDGPGLGFELDLETIEGFRVEKPVERPDPPRLIETTWPDGRRMYCANDGKVNFMIRPAQQGRIPFFERGVMTRLLPDDGSEGWQQLFRKAKNGPFLIDS
jgi:galactonate dehydratase